MQNPHSTKAFTLIEVLIVLTILGLMGVISLTMFINSTGTFQFLSDYDAINSTIRTARSMAINNSDYGGVKPERYGMYFSIQNSFPQEIIFFIDDGEKAYEYEPDDGVNPSDTVIENKSLSLDFEDYKIHVRDPDNIDIVFPTIFYETGTGELTVVGYNTGYFEVIPKTDSRYISIELEQKKKKQFKKYIILNQISGLPEKYDTLP